MKNVKIYFSVFAFLTSVFCFAQKKAKVDSSEIKRKKFTNYIIDHKIKTINVQTIVFIRINDKGMNGRRYMMFGKNYEDKYYYDIAGIEIKQESYLVAKKYFWITFKTKEKKLARSVSFQFDKNNEIELIQEVYALYGPYSNYPTKREILYYFNEKTKKINAKTTTTQYLNGRYESKEVIDTKVKERRSQNSFIIDVDSPNLVKDSLNLILNIKNRKKRIKLEYEFY